MIVSHEHRFIALGNRKCASTSLMNLLAPFQEETAERFELIRTELEPEVLGTTIPKHFDAAQAKAVIEALGRDWHDYTKIVVIRDPWRRLVSHYKWRQRRTPAALRERWPSGTTSIAEPNHRRIVRKVIGKRVTEFDHFSWWVQHRPHIPTLSLGHFAGLDARSLEAFAVEGFGIVRLEAFAAEIGSVLGGLGVTVDADAAPELNRSADAVEYTRYFDASAIDFVAETFAVDIAVGGYSFPS